VDWGINGVASVLGSTLAVVLVIVYGFTFALPFGGASYFMASFVMLPNKRQALKKIG